MVKRVFAVLFLASATGLVGCAGSASTNAGGRVGDKKEEFTIDTWKLPISVKKGDTTHTDFAITRGKDFSDSVSFKIEDSKKGLTFDPAEPKIDNSTNKTSVKISAADKADIGEHTITVSATPSKGGEHAKATFTVKVTE